MFEVSQVSQANSTEPDEMKSAANHLAHHCFTIYSMAFLLRSPLMLCTLMELFILCQDVEMLEKIIHFSKYDDNSLHQSLSAL